MASGCEQVLRELRRYGLLLQQDKTLPSVVGIITGESLSGSWWSHPRGQEIFACLSRLEDRDDVLVTRLIGRKVTFVHESLRPALFAVGTSREDWQTRGLSHPARSLLRKIEEGGAAQATGAAARELQERLLVAAEEIHTDAGKHAVALRPWRTAIGRVRKLGVADAKDQLEKALVTLGGAPAMLPWKRKR